MIYQTFEITALGETAKLVTYIRSQAHLAAPEPWPLVLVIPGGGYLEVVQREAEPIACAFNARGFHAAVLHYSTAPAVFPAALVQEALAIRLIRQHAAQWNVDPDKIFVSGYSAGGHLAASIGVFWNRPFLSELAQLEPADMRPAGLALAYPVITAGEYAHAGSMRNLLGKKYGDAELTELVSLEKQVSADTPPTFIWSTAEDAVVPVENTLLFAGALQRNHVDFEMHVYPRGPHGLALVTEDTIETGNAAELRDIADWPDHAALFMRRVCARDRRG